MLGAKKQDPVVLAIEHRADTDDTDASTSADSVHLAPQRLSQQYLDSAALFGGPATPSFRPASSASANRLSNVIPVSPALFDGAAGRTNTAPIAPSPSAPNSRHSRRISRHARTPSVSTKRESMEIMGGLGAGLGLDMPPATSPMHATTSTRRRSSRMSNLPSASVLFGAPEPSSTATTGPARDGVQQWDWRKAIADAAEQADESADDRLTALEKLEGRAAPAQKPHTDSAASESKGSRASKRLSSHARTESIQIPNLDEIHQNEIKERRASWNQLAASFTDAAATTPTSATFASASSRRHSWGINSLAPPSSAPLLAAGFSSPALPSSYLTSPARPESMIARAESPQPEGLGTLMEEEEEDDASPTRERASLDMPTDGRTSAEHELRKQRREAEDEIVKRNRRTSLAPKPLKLKSRPPSLYLTPSQRNGLVTSPSMPNFAISPLLPASIADEATPKAAPAVLADTDVSQSETTDSLPSRSATCPDLSKVAQSPEQDSTDSVLEAHSEPTNAPAAEASASLAKAHTAPADEQRRLEELQQQILRDHRRSFIAPSAAHSTTPSTAESGSASSASSSSRQGMRTLRLGSQASLAAIMESGASSGSAGSAASASASASAQRRRSLIMGPSTASLVSGSSSRDSDFAAALAGSSGSSRAARRSSIIYKPATAAVPESSSPHSASDSIVSLGGVPLAVHDELKLKANRDAALLESTKKQVETLERELANETERSARERAELEQWNMDKEEHLFDRAQRAETAASNAEQAADALRAELDQAKEQLEDLHAEREVLQDDIEGWRSRCQDLEKTLRTEKAKSDDARKLRAAARLRIKQLTDAIERTGAEVPADDLGVWAALDQPQLDLAAVLRSPNLGAVSPNLSATPRLSPSIGSEEAPPQITKLLADMRQQIFNLAGSLEHERKQHLHSKEEIARLQQEAQQPIAKAEAKADTGVEQSFSSADDSRDRTSSNSDSFSSARRSSGVLGKNKRHVFAYDSSMGSFGQSQSSASLSMTATDDTAVTDNESDLSDSFSTKLPASASDSELVGLGMGSLQTLDEIEEVSEVSESVEGSNGTLSAALDKNSTIDAPHSPAWIDVEAGSMDACRPSMDMSESSFGASYQDAEVAPPTPDLYRSSEGYLGGAEGFGAASAAVSADHSVNASSASSSGESHAAPSTPPPHARLAEAEQMRSPSPRPEFHREWSFEWGKSRSRQLASSQDSVEDFFGILREDRLPALSTSDEALDLPPIVVQGNGAILPTARINKDGKPVYGGAATRAASVWGGRRPPVARSAYLRESFDSTAAVARPATSSALQHAYGHEAHASSASSLAALGSRALSRMSLQGLTGAFSGLSGYLTNQSGAAVTAAAAATQMCNAQTRPGFAPGAFPVHADVLEEEERAPVGWITQRRLDEDDEAPAKSQAARRYVRKSAVPPPTPTAVWLLDFARSTAHAGPLFNL